MPQPDRSTTHIDAIATNMSVAYIQQQSAFIASKVFPIIPVEKPSNKYFIFDKNAWFVDSMERRPPSSESAGSGYTISTDNYSCDVWALHKDIDDQLRETYDQPLDPDRNAAQWLTQMGLLRMEIQWVADYFTTGVWATDVTPSNLWSDYAASNPIKDVRTGVRSILITTGFKPNKLVLGYDVWNTLQDHPDIVDRMKTTDDKVVTTGLLAKIFNIEQVLVAESVKATNNEGGTAAYDFIHGKHALLVYSNPAPAIEMPSAGYTYMWRGISKGLGATVAVSSFRMEHLKSDRKEIEMAWDNKRTGSDLGYFFNGAVA